MSEFDSIRILDCRRDGIVQEKVQIRKNAQMVVII